MNTMTVGELKKILNDWDDNFTIGMSLNVRDKVMDMDIDLKVSDDYASVRELTLVASIQDEDTAQRFDDTFSK